jgi:hypothetical protein
MNKSSSTCIRVSKEELKKLKQVARLEASHIIEKNVKGDKSYEYNQFV